MKSVQELAISGEEPPKQYFHEGSSNGQVLTASVPLVEIPVVDLSLLLSDEQELQKLKLVMSSWGCVQVINHGMTDSFIDKVREVSKEFFHLPMEEKQKYRRQDGAMEGYGDDISLSKNQTLNWSDRLFLTIRPEEQKQLNFWPTRPESFRETVQEYTMKSMQISEILLKAMAKSLNLKENCFLNQCQEGALVAARFNYYPPCPRPEQILGQKDHADATAITILIQDKEVEGLQFQRDNEWYRVPSIPHALLINVGDFIEIMSNGIFKSRVHRVLTNSERERFTLAIFFVPSSDIDIKPADELVNETSPRLYKTVRDYVRIYAQHFKEGKRPIEAAMI